MSSFESIFQSHLLRNSEKGQNEVEDGLGESNTNEHVSNWWYTFPKPIIYIPYCSTPASEADFLL